MKKVWEPSLRKTSGVPLKDDKQTTANGITEAKELKRSKDFLECNERWYAGWWNHLFWQKMFTVEAKFKSQNDRILAKSADSISIVVKSIFRCQKPASAMVWAAISESWKSPLIFAKEGAKINANSYIDDILTPIHAQMKKHFKDRPFTFQQDDAPSHTVNKTQDCCERYFPSFGRRNNCGILYRQTWILCSFVCGLLTIIRKFWKSPLSENEPKSLKKRSVQQ